MKSTTANSLPKPDAVADIIAYHDRTKHQPERYARGPGGLDWANQPDPFRRFTGAPVLPLPLAVIELKKPGVPARAAFDENLTRKKERIDTSP